MLSLTTPKRALCVLSVLAVTSFAFADKIHQPKLTPQSSGTTQGLIAVSPVNERVVWASGRGGTFVKTTNGGKTWTAGVVPGAEALQVRESKPWRVLRLFCLLDSATGDCS